MDREEGLLRSGWAGAAMGSGPKDVWGIGAGGSGVPWAVHFNGRSWFKVSIPVESWAASGNARAGDWVIGELKPQPKTGPVVKVLHWTASGWKAAPLPKLTVPAGDVMIPGNIAAISPTSVWASVVIGARGGSGPATDAIMHWNGTAWTRLRLPSGSLVGGLAGDGSGGLWVMAHNLSGAGYVLHYLAGKWTRGSLPVKSGTAPTITSLTSVPATKSILAGAAVNDIGVVIKYGA